MLIIIIIIIITKACNTCVAPLAAYRSCSGAVYVTDRADAYTP